MADETTETTETETTETETTEGAETAPHGGTGEEGSGEDTGTGSGDESTEDETDGGDAHWQAEIAKREAEIDKYKKIARAQEAKYKAAVKGSSEPETGSGSRTPSTQQTANSGGQQEEAGSTQETSEDRIQQLAEEIDRIKADQAEAARERTIAEVAKAKGLTVEQASRLRGNNREELEADADEVIALFGLDQTKKTTPGPAPKPKEKRPQRGGSSNGDANDDGRSRKEILAAVTDTSRRTRK